MNLFSFPGESSDFDRSADCSQSEYETICVCNNCDGNDTSTKCQSRTTLCSGKTIDKPVCVLVKLAWSFVFTVMACFFFAAAYVQHNDPDPILWMPAYLIPWLVNISVLIVSYYPSQGYLWKTLNWIITAHISYCSALGFWTLVHYFHRQLWNSSGSLETFVSEPNMEMEEAKELIGLCLVIAWLSLVSNQNYLRFGRQGIIFASLLTCFPIISWVLVEKLELSREQTCL